MTKISYVSYLATNREAEISQCARQESIINKLVGLKRAEKERQKHIQELEKQIGKLKETMESPLETEDQGRLDAELVSSMKTINDRPLRAPLE